MKTTKNRTKKKGIYLHLKMLTQKGLS